MNSRPKNRAALGTISLVLLLASGLSWAGARVVSGQWEYTTTTDGQPGSRKVTACMKADEAAGLNGDEKTSRAYFDKKMRGPCSIKTFEVKGDTISYLLNCGDRTIENKVTFHGETSEGVTVVKTAGATLTTRTKARRLGACP